jgi:hypothetical protein
MSPDNRKAALPGAARYSDDTVHGTTGGQRQSIPRAPLPLLPALLRRIASGRGDDVAADALRLSAVWGTEAVIAVLRGVGLDLLNEEVRFDD